MLAQIPELTMTGRIPLELPIGALLALLWVAMLALGVVTETGLLDRVRSRMGLRPTRLQGGRIATAAWRG